jgi:hypothetical protein
LCTCAIKFHFADIKLTTPFKGATVKLFEKLKLLKLFEKLCLLILSFGGTVVVVKIIKEVFHGELFYLNICPKLHLSNIILQKQPLIFAYCQHQPLEFAVHTL